MRLGLAVGASVPKVLLAHRAFCARLIVLRAAADSMRRFLAGPAFKARLAAERRVQTFNFFLRTITFFLQLLDYSRQVCHRVPSAEDCISIRQEFPSCRVLDNHAKHGNWTLAAFRCVYNSALPAEASHVLLELSF